MGKRKKALLLGLVKMVVICWTLIKKIMKFMESREDQVISTHKGLIIFIRILIKRINLILHYGDLTDSTNILNIIQKVSPDEIYNLGAQSHVSEVESPEYTANCDARSIKDSWSSENIKFNKQKKYTKPVRVNYRHCKVFTSNETTPLSKKSLCCSEIMPIDNCQL